MLTITIPGTDLYDEKNNLFIKTEAVVLDLEHSLVSLSKWESKFEKPFLVPGKKTSREVLGYVEAMIVTPNYPVDVIMRLTNENLAIIQDYIDSKQTATTFRHLHETKGRAEIVTAEVVYYWMFSCQIPLECETWHLNRLFTLIQVFSAKNKKPKRVGKHAIAQQYRDINAARRARLGTRG